MIDKFGGRGSPVKSCIPAMLRDRARSRPDEMAFTFVDYEQNSAGLADSLTWSQVYRRALSVAQALTVRGSIGDRAAILAPHGLDYIAAFLGALEAGLVAVPLSAPVGIPVEDASDDHVAAVLRDASPAVILTTSSLVGTVTKYVNSQRAESAPLVVYVDWLDAHWRKDTGPGRESWPSTAYLHYASGSTRQPAGVVVSHNNLVANTEQLVFDYCDQRGTLPPPDTTVVSWLPFDHDMGLLMGICAPIMRGFHAVLMSPASFLQRPARWVQLMASNHHVWSAAPDFAYDLAVRRTSDDDMAGLDLRHVLGILDSGERIHPTTLERFTKRFARFHLGETVVRPTYGLAEATAYVATRLPPRSSQIVRFESDRLSAGHAQRSRNGRGTALVSYGVPRSPIVRIVDSDTRIECPAGTIGEIWVYRGKGAVGYWHKPEETERIFGARLVTPSRGTPEGPWLRTGDRGFFSYGELFILGRLEDRSIARGRDRFPDDIDVRLSEIARSGAVSRGAGNGRGPNIESTPGSMPCAG